MPLSGSIIVGLFTPLVAVIGYLAVAVVPIFPHQAAVERNHT